MDYYRDEELGAIGVLASVGHRQPSGAIVLQFEVLVSKPGEKNGQANLEKLSTTDHNSHFSP